MAERKFRKKEDLFIKEKRKSKKFFITGSNISGGANSTTISSSVFTEMSKSFEDGVHLIDSGMREANGPLLYMMQQMSDDIEDMFNELSASSFESSFFPATRIDSGSFGLISSSLVPDKDDTYSLGLANKEWRNLYVDGTANIDTLAMGTTVTTIKDEDNMSSNSATALATQQSIKAYADTKIPSSDLLDEDNMASNSATKVASQQSIKAYADTKISTSDLVDEDNMASNSATKVPSQQSVKAYVDANAGGGSTDLTAVDSNIIPDGDNTRDLGSSTNEFKDLYIDGIAYIDSARIGAGTIEGAVTTTGFQSKGTHVLGGATSGANGVETITSINVTPHLLNARRRNLFIMNVSSGNVHGFVGNGTVGEVVTIIALQRCTVHHAETGVNSTAQYQDPRSRDITMLANTSARFIYTGSFWVRMV